MFFYRSLEEEEEAIIEIGKITLPSRRPPARPPAQRLLSSAELFWDFVAEYLFLHHYIKIGLHLSSKAGAAGGQTIAASIVTAFSLAILLLLLLLFHLMVLLNIIFQFLEL